MNLTLSQDYFNQQIFEHNTRETVPMSLTSVLFLKHVGVVASIFFAKKSTCVIVLHSLDIKIANVSTDITM